MKKLGLIVNPVAGLGGTVGLKGTDGPELLERARQLGASEGAERRAKTAVAQLSALHDDLEIRTYGGSMGETAIASCGWHPIVVGGADSPSSTAKDTADAARILASSGVDLLLFAGGDGTARDVHDAAGLAVTCLGIPAGVKIQSAVYATSPAAAGRIAADFLSGEIRGGTRQAEVMDIDENEYRRGVLSARLYGYLEVPDATGRLQNRKESSAPGERTAQEEVAAAAIDLMNDECFFLIGPGTTCGALMKRLGLDGSLLGVDLVRAGELVGKDLSEREILSAVGDASCRLILTPIGGQGFLLGRGNQQISPEVMDKVGKERIVVLATPSKLASLRGRPLLVDTGDAVCDSHLCGYYRVVTGYREETVYRVSVGA